MNVEARRRWRSGVAALLLAPLGSGCGPKAEKAATGDVEPRPIPVTVAALEHRPVERTVEIVGTLKGYEEVTVGSKKAGRVIKVLHDMGDRVRPGEALVELEKTDAQLARDQAETKYLTDLVKLGITRKQAEDFLARYGIEERLIQSEDATRLIEQTPAIVQARLALEKAEQDLDRQRKLTARNAGTYQDLQNFENALKTADAALDNARLTARTIIANALTSRVTLAQARQSLEDMEIAAPRPTSLPPGHEGPVAYAVSRRRVSEGQMVREGDPIAELVIADTLKLWAEVPERFSAEIKVGQPVRLTVASHPNETFEGKVTRINPAVDPVSRTFQVEAAVPNQDNRLRPGGFANAAIVTRSDAEATVVPREAIYRFAGVTEVFVVEGDKVRAVPVRTELEGRDWVEVRGDLPEKARVVTTGQTQLANGTPIVIRKPEAGPAPAPTPAASTPSPVRAGM